MVHLHLLGSLGLRTADGQEIQSVLSQPRRVALLAYLAAARPRGYHRRDTLFALFWPDSDTGRARNALNQAIHRLRQSLGEGVLISRGDEEIGLNPEVFWCDAAAFEEALGGGDCEAALDLYRGDLLPGFFISDAWEFEAWLDRERARLRTRACEGASALATREEASGRLHEAAGWTRRALDLRPDDQAVLHRLLRLLDRLSDRPAALRIYEEFAERLHREYGLEPAAETQALVGEIRGRNERTEHAESTPSPPPLPDRTPIVGHAHGKAQPIRSIAVLPFADLSPGKDQEYLGDGLAEELLGALSKIEGLRVPARTSAFAFRGEKADVREIGWKLGAEAVLEGSVRTAGSRLRVTAQLIGATDGFHLWSETYDCEMEDVFAIQEEIARSIVRAIRGRIAGGAASAEKREEDPEAHHFYLKGRYFMGKRSHEGLRKAVGYFLRAIDRDSTHARAYTGLADAYQLQAFYGFGSFGEARSRSRAAVEKALEIDDDLAEAHASFASILSWEGNAIAAEREYRRAIELNPNYAQARQWYASFLRHRGHLQEALYEAEGALYLDPLSMAVMLTIGMTYRALRHYDHAIEQYQRVLEMDPTYAPALHWLSGVYALTGQDDRAIATAERAVEYGGEGSLYLGGLGFAQALAGQRENAEHTLERLQRLAETEYASACDLALVHIGIGKTSRALDCLEQACDEGDPSVRELLVDPTYDPLRSDPRFQKLLRRVRLVE
jgi:adenylate cyclase